MHRILYSGGRQQLCGLSWDEKEREREKKKKKKEENIVSLYAIVWWHGGNPSLWDILSTLLTPCTINLIQARSVNPRWLCRVRDNGDEYFHLLGTQEQQETGKLVLLYYVDAGRFLQHRQDSPVEVCVCVCVYGCVFAFAERGGQGC